VRVEEPAIDLGISLCLASSLYMKPIDPDLVILGEVGLAGEIRGVSQVEMRLKEAQKLGFKRCVLPQINLDRLSEKFKGKKGLEFIGVGRIEEAVSELF